MSALEVGGAPRLRGEEDSRELNDRPTIPMPAPRESGVRLQVSRIATSAATVDVVVCDLSRDPRSESYVPGPRRPVVKVTPLRVLLLEAVGASTK